MAETARARPPADGVRGDYPPTFFDAVLVVAFGGPEGMDDVMPFLENVTRGRNVPRERLEEVAHHYALFDGVSPINAQNRALVAALREELNRYAIDLPVYLGNRNWHPLLEDTVREMRDDGVRRALAFFTSAFSSYSSCRQYRENILDGQAAVGTDAPEIVRMRSFYNHPGFVIANVERVNAALAQIPAERRDRIQLVFTAHSIPQAMARQSRYELQLAESARLVANGADVRDHALVYPSRSGAPHVPRLGPDVCDHIVSLAGRGVEDVILSPIGFVSDHIEILFDLDVEARDAAGRAGVNLVRAQTAGTHPAFVAMIRELIQERLDPAVPRRALGRDGPSHDLCLAGCCLPG